MVEVTQRDTTSKKDIEGQLSTGAVYEELSDSEYETMIPQTHTAQIAMVKIQPNRNPEQFSADYLNIKDGCKTIDSQTLAMQAMKECTEELGTDEDNYEVVDETSPTTHAQTVAVQHNAAYRLLDVSGEHPHECSEMADEASHATQVHTLQHNAAYRLLDVSGEHPHECSEMADKASHATQVHTVQHNAAYRLLDVSGEHPHEISEMVDEASHTTHAHTVQHNAAYRLLDVIEEDPQECIV